jgi:hypothetical protein
MDNVNPPVAGFPDLSLSKGPNAQHISVIDPIGPAIEHVRLMLFRPFDISKWFIVGFCAWLAYMGQGGGGGSNFNFSSHHNDFSQFKDALLANLPWIIIIGVIVIPIIIIIGLLLCWLSSRGQFMFVHCVAGNKAEVAVPWNKFARHSNSLFLFRIVLGLIGLVVVGLPMAFAVFAFLGLHAAGLTAAAVGGLLAAILGVIALAMFFVLIRKFTNDFVVPIMSLQTASSLAGWRIFLSLLGAHKGQMLLYVLFQILISMVIGFISFFICVIGCCCCCIGIVLLVPYVGTVILLPLFAFKRAYSLFYLRQFGPQFDVFRPQVT